MSTLAYHGGPIIDTPHYESFFLGSQWGSPAAPSGTPQEAGAINAFMNTLVRGKYVDLLRQYGVNPGGPSTNPSSYGGFGALLGNPSSNTVADREIQSMLDRAYRQGDMGGFIESQTLFMVFTDVNLTVQDPSGHVSQGYHNYFHTDASGGHDIYYAVVPDQTSNQNLPGLTDFQRITLKASQEFVDGVTDPTLQGFGINAHSGWWRDTFHGPVAAGDFDTISNQQYGMFNGYFVTRVLNNATGKVALPSSGATFNPDNPPQHAPFVATALGRISANNALEESFALDANGNSWYQRQQQQTDSSGRPILTWGPWLPLGVKNGTNFDGRQLVVEEFDGASSGFNDGDYNALWVFAKDKNGQLKFIQSDQNGNFGDMWTDLGRNGTGDPQVAVDFFAVGQKVTYHEDGRSDFFHYLQVYAIAQGQLWDIARLNDLPGNFQNEPWQVFPVAGYPKFVTLAAVNMSQSFNYAQTLVAVATDGSVWTSTQRNDYDSDNWDNWQNLGKVGAGAYAAPAVALRADGFLEIFLVDQKGNVWHSTQDSFANGQSGWQTWQYFQDFTAAPTSQVTVVADNYGLELFVLDQGGSLWTIQQTWGTDDFSDSKWFQLGGSFSLNGFNTFAVSFNQFGHVEFLGLDQSGNLDWATQVYGSRAWN
jgi:hypothetical protein